LRSRKEDYAHGHSTKTSRADPIAIPGTRRTASTSRKTEAFARRQRRCGMAGSQQGMGTEPRFRSATNAVVRDKTWPSKRKGLVEVLRRRRPSVCSGSTPEIEIVRARSKETATQLGGKSTSLLAQLGLRLPRMQLGSYVAKIQAAWSRARSVIWLISASVRPFIASAARSSGSDISTPV
jgi:hypothetical protein